MLMVITIIERKLEIREGSRGRTMSTSHTILHSWIAIAIEAVNFKEDR